MKKQKTIFHRNQAYFQESITFYKKILLIAAITLCSIPTIESSYFLRGAGKAFEILRNNKLNTLCVGGVGYQIFAENANEAKINILAQELIQTQSKNDSLMQELIQAQSNTISKTTFWTVATILGLGCYMAIRTTYKNMLLNRPKIEAIIQSAKNIEEAINELKKYSYKKQNLIPIKAALLKKFTDAEIAKIEAQLS